MKKQPYQAQHMKERVGKVKDIWIREALLKERAKHTTNLLIRGIVAYTIGFVEACYAPHWWIALISLISSVIFYLLWKYVMQAWGIPASEKL